jgi:hypothetical protein
MAKKLSEKQAKKILHKVRILGKELASLEFS